MRENGARGTLSRLMRDVLISHLDCGRPVASPRDIHSPTNCTVLWLIKRGLVYVDSTGRFTRLTETGRNALAEVLADYADALVRAGYTPLDERAGQRAPRISMHTRLPPAPAEPDAKSPRITGISVGGGLPPETTQMSWCADGENLPLADRRVPDAEPEAADPFDCPREREPRST